MGCNLSAMAEDPALMQGGFHAGPPQAHHQRCFKCAGKGFSHDSHMEHDRPPDQRCFFCTPCGACGATGALQTPAASAGLPGFPSSVAVGPSTTMRVSGGGLQACFKCAGKGFCHESSMDHDKGPGERCFFCKPCAACSGTGAIEGSSQAVRVCHGVVPTPFGAMAAPVAVVEELGPQRCFKCSGRGFCHESSMEHDKAPHERCFFCKKCTACSGSGAIGR